MNEISRKLAQAALDIGAIKLQPKNPFTWTTGYKMPIYNDNRLLMGSYPNRVLAAEGFRALLTKENLKPDLIAGVATGGIAPATTLANELRLPFVYVRGKAKGHGTGKLVEGLYSKGQSTVVIEDLISTGTSSVAAVQTLREAELKVDLCISIFNYGFKEASAQFENVNCRSLSLFTFDELFEVAKSANRLSQDEIVLLENWKTAPFEWGQKLAN